MPGSQLITRLGAAEHASWSSATCKALQLFYFGKGFDLCAPMQRLLSLLTMLVF